VILVPQVLEKTFQTGRFFFLTLLWKAVLSEDISFFKINPEIGNFILK
jgi:hypothetical protein